MIQLLLAYGAKPDVLSWEGRVCYEVVSPNNPSHVDLKYFMQENVCTALSANNPASASISSCNLPFVPTNPLFPFFFY